MILLTTISKYTLVYSLRKSSKRREKNNNHKTE